MKKIFTLLAEQDVKMKEQEIEIDELKEMVQELVSIK